MLNTRVESGGMAMHRSCSRCVCLFSNRRDGRQSQPCGLRPLRANFSSSRDSHLCWGDEFISRIRGRTAASGGSEVSESRRQFNVIMRVPENLSLSSEMSASSPPPTEPLHRAITGPRSSNSQAQLGPVTLNDQGTPSGGARLV